MRFSIAAGGLAAVSAAVLTMLQPIDEKAERLARHINLGKAFYENPATPKEAVEEFRRALDLNPNSAREHLNYGLALLRAGRTKEGVAEMEKVRSMDRSLPHPYFNLGVVFKREGNVARALREFTQMARLAPDDAVTRYNLGALYKLEGASEKAMAEFETAARLDPAMAAPRFQLFNAYRVAKHAELAQRELEIFNAIKKQQAASGASEDVEWSYYSEILDIIPAAAGEGAPPVEVVFEGQRVGSVAGAGLGVLALDADADGRLDLAAWSAERVVLFRNSAKGFTAAPIDGAAASVSAGDFNNDGFPDLCVAASGGARLAVNRKGAFASQEIRGGAFRRCLWVDYDHDYDLDLLLLGTGQVLLRNNGDGTWADVSKTFPFAAGEATDAAALELGENNGFDIVAAYRDRPAVVYRDRKMGRYEAAPLAFSIGGRIEAGDFNHDGFLDLASVDPGGISFVENRRGALQLGPRLSRGGPAAFADFQNRGRTDLLAGGEMLVHRGGFRYDAGKARGAPQWTDAASGDFNNDGLTDAAVVAADGSVHLLRNATPGRNAWLRVALTGVKNQKLAAGARVEVKAGRLYQKKLYQGAPLVFGLPGYARADTVRITWPNGLIQNEPRQAVAAHYNYKEAQRLSGSCPMIFTWNGRQWEFISDVLGVAPLGAGLGDGEFFPVDHDEYIQVSGRSLVPRDGHYEVRITEELREVSYLDQIQLIAVDHPARLEIFSNDKFKSPPFPSFRLFGVERRIYPRRAVDHRGRDVRERILRRDHRYPDGFQRDLGGRAETHWVELDLGAVSGDSVLYLHGWVDWADGSTFVAVAQSGARGLAGPALQVKDAAGNWVTVIEDMGMPAGKPKTIAVDLRGKFRSGSREVRIVTSMSVYWDEIFLGEDPAEPEARLTRMSPDGAELGFRGFSAVRVDPDRRQPERFDYSVARPAAMWNPTSGHYTRYGGVRELLAEIDDRFVLMGSGDELRLKFRASRLPALPAGWTRDFLILVDGWAKDGDANTAFGGTVEPLPFHGMSRYPYGAGERYPDGAAHQEYRRAYNTRSALRLIRRLAE